MIQNQMYLKIQSNINVNVTGGLKHLDMTDSTAAVGDKLKVQPLWAKEIVRIAPGASYYPAEIKNWKTVQALAKDRIITLGEEVDTLPNDIDEEQLNFIISNFNKLNEGKEEIKRQAESLKSVKKTRTQDKDSIKLEDLEL
jgi:hypothetical protein